MTSTLEQDILKVLEQTRDEIRANMEAKAINASGRTSESIHVETYDKGFRLVGGSDGQHDIADSPGIYGSDTAPIPTLEFGRDGGAVPRGFYYIIRQWSREKGIQFANESERNTFAFFVSRKIAREGTKRGRVHADVYGTPVANAKERIQAAIQASMSNTIKALFAGGEVTTLQGAFS